MFKNDTGKRRFGFMDLVVLFAALRAILYIIAQA